MAIERDRGEEETRVAAEASRRRWPRAARGREAEARAVEQELARLVASMHEIELRATEGRVRREELAQEAWRSYGVAAEALLRAGTIPRAISRPHAIGALDELDEKLPAIGAVNLVADEEYRELDERLTFLKTQHDDLDRLHQGPREGAARHDAHGTGALRAGFRGDQRATSPRSSGGSSRGAAPSYDWWRPRRAETRSTPAWS